MIGQPKESERHEKSEGEEVGRHTKEESEPVARAVGAAKGDAAIESVGESIHSPLMVPRFGLIFK